MRIQTLIKLKKYRIRKYKKLIQFDNGYQTLLNKCLKDLNRLQEMKG